MSHDLGQTHLSTSNPLSGDQFRLLGALYSQSWRNCLLLPFPANNGSQQDQQICFRWLHPWQPYAASFRDSLAGMAGNFQHTALIQSSNKPWRERDQNFKRSTSGLTVTHSSLSIYRYYSLYSFRWKQQIFLLRQPAGIFQIHKSYTFHVLKTILWCCDKKKRIENVLLIDFQFPVDQ